MAAAVAKIFHLHTKEFLYRCRLSTYRPRRNVKEFVDNMRSLVKLIISASVANGVSKKNKLRSRDYFCLYSYLSSNDKNIIV